MTAQLTLDDLSKDKALRGSFDSDRHPLEHIIECHHWMSTHYDQVHERRADFVDHKPGSKERFAALIRVIEVLMEEEQSQNESKQVKEDDQ